MGELALGDGWLCKPQRVHKIKPTTGSWPFLELLSYDWNSVGATWPKTKTGLGCVAKIYQPSSHVTMHKYEGVEGGAFYRLR